MKISSFFESIFSNLKKFKKLIFLFILSLIFLSCLFVAYVYIDSYYRNMPRIVTEINGIKLGDKLSEVLFRNSGYENIGKNVANVEFENEDYYRNASEKTTIFVKEKRVVLVQHSCLDSFEYTMINGISCNATGEEIQSKYGADLRIQCQSDKTQKDAYSIRVYDVPKYGIRYLLATNSVVGFLVTTPDRLLSYTGRNWISCD